MLVIKFELANIVIIAREYNTDYYMSSFRHAIKIDITVTKYLYLYYNMFEKMFFNYIISKQKI